MIANNIPDTDSRSTMSATPFLHRNSFHVFKHRNKYFLYDLSTSMLCRLNEFAFSTISLLGDEDLDSAYHELSLEYADIPKEAILSCIDELKAKGFFREQMCSEQHQSHRLNVLWQHHPRAIQMFMAQSCNLLCEYCYAEQQGSNDHDRLMSYEVAKSTVDYLIKSSGKRRRLSITFIGGEPLLNLDVIRKTVDYCESQSKQTGKVFDYSISTNGTLLNSEARTFLAERNFSMLVSIDGYKSMHDRHRPYRSGASSYDDVIENSTAMLDIFKKRGEAWRIKARANATSEFCDMPRIVESLESYGFTTIGIAIIRNSCGSTAGQRGDVQSLIVNSEKMHELMVFYDKLADDTLASLEQGNELTPFAHRWVSRTLNQTQKNISTLGLPCGVGRNTNVVDTKGNIFPCHRYVGMDAYCIGNIWSGLDKRKTMDYYNECNSTAMTKCGICWLQSKCSGGCPWERSHPAEGLQVPDEAECRLRRSGVERSLWLYNEIQERFPSTFQSMVRAPEAHNFTFDFDE